MKKIIVLILICGLAIGLSAQMHVFAGLNSDMAKAGAGTTNGKLGFQAGGGYIMNMGTLMIEPGVKFTTRGWEYLDAYYADIFGKIGYNIPGDFHGVLYGGLSVGFCFADDDTWSYSYYSQGKADINPLYMGIQFGARYIFSEKYTVTGEYDWGLTEMYDKGYWKGLSNYTISFSLGYLF